MARINTTRRYTLRPVEYKYGPWVIKRNKRSGKWFYHLPGKPASIHFTTVIEAIRSIHAREDELQRLADEDTIASLKEAHHEFLSHQHRD